jgi:hypothetical protein
MSKSIEFYLTAALIIAIQYFKIISIDTCLLIVTMLWIGIYKIDKS